MTSYDLYERNTRLNTPELPGGVAPTRETLRQHQYQEEKRARLEAEAEARQRAMIDRNTARLASVTRRMVDYLGQLSHGAIWRVQGR